MSRSEELQKAVLDEIQSGFPLESHPYSVIAGRLDSSTADVIDAVDALRASGLIRRIGASFASAKLGFTSVLCALAVPGDEAEIDRVAALVSAHGEVTHNYLRKNHYNLWFTLISASEEVRDGVLDAIVVETGCDDLLVLPATALYKIRVDFSGNAAKHEGGAAEAGAPFSASDPFDVSLVRWAQGDISGEEPFADAAAQIAAEIGDPSIDEERVLARLRSWKADKTMRRFGAMVRHRSMGYLFNGMCVFDASAGSIDEFGHMLAELPFVSHCYARPRSERWPYNLYAMAHAKSQEELEAHVKTMNELVGLEPQVLISTKEYKKSSPIFFSDNAKDHIAC